MEGAAGSGQTSLRRRRVGGGVHSISDITLAGSNRHGGFEEHESVQQPEGSMSQQNCTDPAAFERGNYMKALTSFTGKFISDTNVLVPPAMIRCTSRFILTARSAVWVAQIRRRLGLWPSM